MSSRDRTAPLALLSDFGNSDVYVGVMKGVIAGIAPGSSVIDLTHDLTPFQPSAAAFALQASYRYFPSGTVFCAVVDPGVGSDRRPVAARVRAGDTEYLLVCPDNGLLTPLLDVVTEAVAIENEDYLLPSVGATFHGRDLFAPAAAHLAAGVPLPELGGEVDFGTLVQLDWPTPRPNGNGWLGKVIHVDRFGNLVSNLTRGHLGGPGSSSSWQLEISGTSVTGPSSTFSDVALGDLLAYVGSAGYLEFAVREGSAQNRLGADVGAEVVARPV